jgi:hypothetical protein
MRTGIFLFPLTSAPVVFCFFTFTSFGTIAEVSKEKKEGLCMQENSNNQTDIPF